MWIQVHKPLIVALFLNWISFFVFVVAVFDVSISKRVSRTYDCEVKKQIDARECKVYRNVCNVCVMCVSYKLVNLNNVTVNSYTITAIIIKIKIIIKKKPWKSYSRTTLYQNCNWRCFLPGRRKKKQIINKKNKKEEKKCSE